MIIDSGRDHDISEFVRLAYDVGFTHAAELNMGALIFREEVRAMCSSDRCRSYGRCWSCPPAVGSPDVIAKRAAGYSRGVIVQTTGQTDSDFDMPGFASAMKSHHRNFDTLTRQVRQLCTSCLPMSAGACTRCRTCTYPDRPCRYPGRLVPSMEAYGLLVSDVCIKSGLAYNYGPRTITYTSCILLD